MPIGRKINETLGEIGIVGGQRGLNFTLDHRGIKFVFQRTAGNAAGIVEAVKRICRARHDINRGRSKQYHCNQGRPDPRYARGALRR
jgi:hypothetical protein